MYSTAWASEMHLYLPDSPSLTGFGTSSDAGYTSYPEAPFGYYSDDQHHNSISNSSSDNSQVASSHQLLANAFMPPGFKTPLPIPTNHLLSNVRLNVPSSLGLPVYSTSGFDLLSILSRVTTRPNPKIVLGPVDLTCSFVVVDVRRYDRPIVYASPNFCELTGYTEHEVLGRNCRFLQAPDGNVKKGEERRFVDPKTVQYMHKSVVADKECQASIVNYRKGGQAFINLVSVIPISGGLHNRPEEGDEVVYQVGFQVDLTEQPNAILQKLQDGSYILNYGAGKSIAPSPSITLHDRKPNSLPSKAISKDLHSLLADPPFLQSIPISTSTTMSSEKADSAQESNQMLNLLLLERSPDFIHVLSLKGSFLYVAPSVRRVLGFEPEELVGKSVADFCHPADLIPLMRELKEASVGHSTSCDEQGSTSTSSGHAKPVDLLFRVQSKSNGYVWVECRGRMHVESGKGRKAIILSGRAREMLSMEWGAVARAGGLTPAIFDSGVTQVDGNLKGKEGEFWGILSSQGTLLVVGTGIRDMLGWRNNEVVGKALLSIVAEGDEREMLQEQLTRIAEEDEPVKAICEMIGKDGRRLHVRVVLYRAREINSTISPSPMVFQVQALNSFSPLLIPLTLTHTHNTDIFEELNTSRGSSWQYELQQLKFANQRLMEEADTFQASILTHGQHLAVTSSSHSSLDQTGNLVTISHGVDGDDWTFSHLHEYDAQRSLKRPWHSDSLPS